MAADRDTESHTMEVCVSEISEGCLSRRGNGEEVGAFTAFTKGLDGVASRPPHPGAAMRKVGATCIDPTAIREGIDVRRCFSITARRYSRGRYTAFNMP